MSHRLIRYPSNKITFNFHNNDSDMSLIDKLIPVVEYLIKKKYYIPMDTFYRFTPYGYKRRSLYSILSNLAIIGNEPFDLDDEIFENQNMATIKSLRSYTISANSKPYKLEIYLDY